MARKAKEAALATRDSILDTAERVFLRRGVSRTSLHEIAQAAGVTRGAIYWHFQNKADLFDAMMRRVTLPLETGFACDGAHESSDPLGSMRGGVARTFSQFMHDPQLQRVFEIAMLKTELVDELQVVRDRQVGYRTQCLADIERTFVAAQALGQLDAQAAPAAAALGCLALIDGLLYNWLLHPATFDLQQVGLAAIDAYLAGLAPRAPSRG